MTDIEKIINSLGEPTAENKYSLKVINGEWWIEHDAVGSGQPVEQWLKSILVKGVFTRYDLRVGMTIRYMTNENWDEFGRTAVVTCYSIPLNKIWLNHKAISIDGFLENIKSGRYEIVNH
jgi:hypothetical protein